MSEVLALLISSFLVKKPPEMKKRKENRNYSFLPPHQEKKGVKESQR